MSGKGVPIDFQGAAHYLKLSADQGNADGQWHYGVCLLKGCQTPIDFRAATRYFKSSANHGNPIGQFHYGVSLLFGIGVPFDCRMAAYSFTLAANPRGSNEQSNTRGFPLKRYERLELKAVQSDLNSSINRLASAFLFSVDFKENADLATTDFAISPSTFSAKSQVVVAWMSEHGIGIPRDIVAAARLRERSSGLLGTGAAEYGWCLLTGMGVPLDFTLAAEFFQTAAYAGDRNGENGFGACLERGEGIAPDMQRALFYYRRAAAGLESDGMYNFARCLEYGKGIQRNTERAAKFYRMAADLGHAAAENSFGIFLERGIGVESNRGLAARFYERAAKHGHPDGANNFGFCLEHGRGVTRNIRVAAEYYKFAADHHHPEADANYRRCRRLLGQWDPPDRSSDVSSSRPSRDAVAKAFVACLQEPAQFDAESADLIAAIGRLKQSILPEPTPTKPVTLGRGDSSLVSLADSAGGAAAAVKTPASPEAGALLGREAALHKRLKHPLVIGFREFRSKPPAIVTEYAGNGALAAHLPLTAPTRSAKIIAGTALAMRHLHARGIVHRDLRPENVLLDWDWNPRVADFGHSISLAIGDQRASQRWPLIGSRYLAPECYDGQYSKFSDVFSFGMILFEMAVGAPAFPDWMTPLVVAKKLVTEERRPDIPEWIGPGVGALITECWADDPDDRPTFVEIVERLTVMNFKVTRGVNSAKVKRFVADVRAREASGE
jgi:TPR repeat protein